jgi:hypothetical protein
MSRRRWLAGFLEEAFGRAPPARMSTERVRTRTRAKRLVLASMHERGLSLGAPLLRREQLLSRDAGELLPLVRWLAVVADHVDLCGYVLDEPGLSPAEAARRRSRALAAALALVYGDDEGAQILASGDVPTRADKILVGLEREIARRRYLRGNPILGLLLNHAFVAIDSRAIIVSVVSVYGRTLDKDAALKVQAALRAERLATLAAIARLSEWRELIDADVVRSASVWQVKSLGLPRADTARLLEQTKKPADLSRLVTLVPAGAQGRVFQQTMLAACVDGRVSPEERELTSSLGQALGIHKELARRIERRVRAFVAVHGDELNPLIHAAGFAGASPPIAVRIARVVFENMDALWKEIRETGDLAYLLARRASGQRLNGAEQKRMREQLIDVVKAVPSLAVFTLPGGFILLPIVLKLLPFDLRPSNFKKQDARFRAFAKNDDDAVTHEDMERAEEEFLRSEVD